MKNQYKIDSSYAGETVLISRGDVAKLVKSHRATGNTVRRFKDYSKKLVIALDKTGCGYSVLIRSI